MKPLGDTVYARTARELPECVIVPLLSAQSDYHRFRNYTGLLIHSDAVTDETLLLLLLVPKHYAKFVDIITDPEWPYHIRRAATAALSAAGMYFTWSVPPEALVRILKAVTETDGEPRSFLIHCLYNLAQALGPESRKILIEFADDPPRLFPESTRESIAMIKDLCSQPPLDPRLVSQARAQLFSSSTRSFKRHNGTPAWADPLRGE